MRELGHSVAHERGVYYFSGLVSCPLSGIGARAANFSNRLALDDDHSRLTFDPATKTIHLRNTHAYARKQLVGDLLLLGTGQTKEGHLVPLAFHTRFEKKGTRFDARPHLHPSVSAQLVSATCEPITVVLDNGKKAIVALDHTHILKAWKYPPLASRLGRALIEVKDSPECLQSGALVDLRVSLGLGRFSKNAVRVQLLRVSDEKCELPPHVTLDQLFRVGTWELRLEALMNLPSAREHVRRALFLLDLEQGPLLTKLEQTGLKKGESLAFRLEQNSGELRMGADTQTVSQATDVARAYLEFDFVGAILAEQLRSRLNQSLTSQGERAKPLAL